MAKQRRIYTYKKDQALTWRKKKLPPKQQKDPDPENNYAKTTC
jgi:hypothetical protein